MTSVSRTILATANGEGQLRNTPPKMDDVLNISEMLDLQPKNEHGQNRGPTQNYDSYESAYEAGLASGREAGYGQGYRAGFLDGYKLRNPAREKAATPHRTTAESNKSTAKSVTRLRGLPCAHCGRPTYNDELECASCGTPKVHPVRDRLARGK